MIPRLITLLIEENGAKLDDFEKGIGSSITCTLLRRLHDDVPLEQNPATNMKALQKPLSWKKSLPF